MALTELKQVSPDEMGLDSDRWEAMLTYAQKLVDNDTLPALSIQVQRHGMTTGVHCFGRKNLAETEPIDDSTIFLVASLTKPMVAMAVLGLVERGQIALNDRVSKFVPGFREGPKKSITIRQLLTHTSGLPDMLPNNLELRQSRSPLSAFVKGTCKVDLLFPPGRDAQYQSMGYALLAPIIEKVTGMPYQLYLRSELFEPLEMQDTWLGLPGEFEGVNRIAEVEVPEAQRGGHDWNWNSSYWRQLGAPWGGVLTTITDVSRFCRCMLERGRPLFSERTVAEATANRLGDFAGITDTVRRAQGWGYGWRMNWREQRGTFGDLLSPGTYGHWGATGTLFWVDPAQQVSAVLLATRSIDKEVSPLVRLSNMISAACSARYQSNT